MLRLILSIVSIQLLVGQALACIGSGESFNIGFREGTKAGDLIITLREANSDSFQEIVDTTGYLSVHLAITRLANEARATKTKVVPEGSGTLEFLKSRVEQLDRYFSERLDASAKPDFKTAIKKLHDAVNENPAKTDAIVSGIYDVNGFLYDNKIDVKASQRRSASAPFSDEISMRDIKLPTYVLSRSLSGCNAGIGSFNSNISKSSSSSRNAETAVAQ